MSARRLPGTELLLSPIIFGTTRAGVSWSGREADRMLDMYLDLGGNAVDTARIYSPPDPGCGERVIGEWLRRSGKRGKIVLITKGGHPPLEDMTRRRMTMADMTADLDASLHALGTDCVDLYYYHRDDPSMPAGELVEQMEAFVRAGKIRYYACSNWTTERMRQADDYARAHGYRGFAANQCLFNAGTRHMLPHPDPTMVTADEAMLRYHSEAPCAMTPYSSLCNGFFHRLAQDADSVRGKKYFTEGNLTIAEKLQDIRQLYGCTMSQALLGFLLTRPFPIFPLAGAGTPAQLADMMGAGDVPFRAEDYQGF